MDPSGYKSKDPDDYESSNIQLICDLKVCMFCLLQISDAEKILGIVQSEVLVVMAEAYDVALEISPGKNDYNSFILHKNNNAHFQTTGRRVKQLISPTAEACEVSEQCPKMLP